MDQPPSNQLGLLANLAATINAPEPALRILVSILIGYPIALLHCFLLHKKEAVVKHLFFTVTGIAIGFFNFGWDISHSFGCVIVQYLLIKILGGRRTCVAVSFVFHMSYLLLGYYKTGTDGYDINWSMPHCVLALRLTGLAFDCYDGQKRPEALSAHQKKTALAVPPSFLEMCGHVFFPGGFLVGPQFSMRRYLDFTSRAFDKECGNITSCVLPGLLRGLLGMMYLVVYEAASQIVPDNYLTSDSFNGSSLLFRLFIVGIWGKICLYKYISCWLITEGVCIVSGLTYNGKDEDGRHQWNGCANVKLRVFENGTRFGHLIMSFNTNTNSWVAEYIYKRLKFLGNRVLSQALTLFFLAFWHGLHVGYYVCFFMEFIIMIFEKQMEVLAVKNATMCYLTTDTKLAPLRWIVGKVYVTVFMGYCLVPFAFFNDYWAIYGSVYYIGFVFFLGWLAASPILMPRLIRQPHRHQPQQPQAPPDPKED